MICGQIFLALSPKNPYKQLKLEKLTVHRNQKMQFNCKFGTNLEEFLLFILSLYKISDNLLKLVLIHVLPLFFIKIIKLIIRILNPKYTQKLFENIYL